MRVPRKLKKKIPKGVYCYSPKEFPSEKTNWVYKINPCLFYKHYEGIEGYCKLTQYGVEDQCKSCGINYPKGF